MTRTQTDRRRARGVKGGAVLADRPRGMQAHQSPRKRQYARRGLWCYGDLYKLHSERVFRGLVRFTRSLKPMRLLELLERRTRFHTHLPVDRQMGVFLPV